MTSPEQQGGFSAPNPTVLDTSAGTDEGRSAEQSISEALVGLNELRQLPVAEHVARFEAVHSALTDALSTAENSMSGSSGGS